MTNGVEEMDQELLGSIKRHAGVGIAVGVVTVIAGVCAIMSPLASVSSAARGAAKEAGG